jgi:pimeloyl-ACP methyl ester carboxylesterase
VRDLGAFIDSQALGRVDLIGHSLGGMIATGFAGQVPQRLHTLVVVDSQLKITPAGARYMVRLRNFPQPVYRDRAQAIQRFRLLPTHTEADERTLQHVAAHGIRRLSDGQWTFKFDREAMAHNEPQDLTPVLHRLECPMLFVRGAHSTLLTHNALAALHGAAPHAEAAEIPAAHHHVMLDNPAEFERVVRTFLDHHRASGTGAHATQRARA